MSEIPEHEEHGSLPARGLLAARSQRGFAIIVAMVFVLIFTILGGALYWLVYSQQHSTETERTDLKAFNVSEAGIDAGMLALKLAWPDQSSDVVTVDNAALKTTLQASTQGLWDPSRSSPVNFLRVTVYDNVNHTTGQTTATADPAAPTWDSNADGKMFVDASANVDNDRHRILVLAELQKWRLTFSPSLALYASVVDSNGQGLGVMVENPNPAPHVPYAYYDVHDAQGKGIDPGYAVAQVPTPTTWAQVVSDSLRRSLEAVAKQQGTYFTSAAATNAFLSSGQANGKVVYCKTNTAVVIGGNSQIGTVAKPVVVVLDTPDGSSNAWDMRGTADFYGILITVGNNELRGTCGIHGALYCSGSLLNKGNGSSEEINYNEQVIQNLNGTYTISVNLVPNTWEEYTLSGS